MKYLQWAAPIAAIGLLSLSPPPIAAESDGPVLTRDGPAVEPEGGLAVGDTISPFSLPLIDGGEVSWPSDLKGQVLVVNFWATWCAPCVEEVPALERLRRQLKGTDVTVVTVNIDEASEMAEVRKLLESSRARFITALDPGGRFALTWGTAKLPETYVIDAQGVVIEKIIGAQLWDRGDRVKTYKAISDTRAAP